MKANLFEELKWRGMIHESTEGVEALFSQHKVTGYIGFDPTADSLHVGSLLPVMGLVHMQRYGHTPVALVGGATGMIGDPSGKSKERNLLDEATLQKNVDGIRDQLSKFLDFEVKENPAKLVNNYDWIGPMTFIQFLRDVGKNFTVNYMMAKESVKRRIDSEEGISFTEFSYMLLQGYDFYHLFENENCVLQLGGSDQWGNITGGIELIRRMTGKKGHGVVFPLLTTASGGKFGKTEEGTIWLDPARTSPYKFYQFWLNAKDDDTPTLLKRFTLLTEEEVSALQEAIQTAPQERAAQRRLAQEVTRMVHGQDALDAAERASRVMFGGSVLELSADEVAEVFQAVPSTELSADEIAGDGIGLLDLMVECDLTKSKGEARRLVQGGGVYLNNERVGEPTRMVTAADAVEGRYMVLRKGSKKYHLVKLLS